MKLLNEIAESSRRTLKKFMNKQMGISGASVTDMVYVADNSRKAVFKSKFQQCQKYIKRN